MENDHVFHGEHTGVCHGIALSMCYGNQGYIDFDDITSGAHDYWTLGSPYENSKNERHDLILSDDTVSGQWKINVWNQ